MEQLIEISRTKESLLNAVIPAMSRTYKPVSHQQLMDLTLETIDKNGFSLKSELYSSARNGNVANGRYIINHGDSEMNLMIGWQNSYDKTLSLKFAIGSHIMICSNGCVSGEMGAFKKKHSGDIQEFTPATIIDYIKASGDVFKRLQEDRERMKEIEMTKKTSAELIGRLYLEEDIVTATQLSLIKRELTIESFNYGIENSLWNTYNAVTVATKLEHPSKWISTHVNIHDFFTKQLV